MDKTQLFELLDISKPEEFSYYENVAALLEEDRVIEQNLIDDLLREVNMESFKDLIKSYFEEFLNRIPDDETDLYFLADTMRRTLMGCEEERQLSDAIYRFRKWYVLDPSVLDKNTGEEISIRDARYNISASNYVGEKPEYDFSKAYNFETDGYDVSIRQMVDGTGI